jgi:RNA-directed DNA polymerase
MTLDGLEEAVRSAVPRRSRVNFIRYADDFIVTSKSKRILETKILPVIKAFLQKRGLRLSPEKTKITYIRDGFTFLGQTFCKHGNKLHITPSKEGKLAVKHEVGRIIHKYRGAPMPMLIKRLNQTLRGWGHYHRWVVSSRAFKDVDNYVFDQLWRLMKRRHSNKPGKWVYKRYWTSAKGHRTFSVKHKTKKGDRKVYQVFKLSRIGAKRYVKVRAHANPYLKKDSGYFYKRRHNKESKIAMTWGDVPAGLPNKG